MTPQERRAYLLIHYAHTRNSELAKLAGVSVQTILKDSRLLGLHKAKKVAAPKLNRLGKTNKKWTPALEEICELMYPVMTNAKLAELVGISISVVGRFCLNKKYVKDRAALDRSKPRQGITKTPRANPLPRSISSKASHTPTGCHTAHGACSTRAPGPRQTSHIVVRAHADKIHFAHNQQVEIMKLRLFALRNSNTNKTIPDLFFSDKQAAKRERDERNKEGGEYAVTPGPDHRKFKP